MLPYDKTYKLTKQMKRGKVFMRSEFNHLVNWIDQQFGQRPIGVFFDVFGRDKRPRLQICFEFEWQVELFLAEDRVNFDEAKQVQIAEQFKKIVEDEKLGKKEKIFWFPNGKKHLQVPLNKLWIYYCAFEPIAKAEAHVRIPKVSIQQLKSQWENAGLWDIHRGCSEVVFLLHTNHQWSQYEGSEMQQVWTDQYFTLLKRYDEFNYFNRAHFQISLNSKENLKECGQENGNLFFM